MFCTWRKFLAHCLAGLVLGFSLNAAWGGPATSTADIIPEEPPLILDETASDVPGIASNSVVVPADYASGVVEVPVDSDLSASMSGNLLNPEGDTASQAILASGPVAPASWTPTLPKTYWTHLDPTIFFGSIRDEKKEAEEEKNVKIEGTLLVEEHQIKKRRPYRRWILEMVDKKRVPLVTNLNLLQALKTPKILDSQVRAEGKWVPSPSDENLKFFAVERMQSFEAFGDEFKNKTASGTLASGPGGIPLASDSPEIALATDSGAIASSTDLSLSESASRTIPFVSYEESFEEPQ